MVLRCPSRRRGLRLACIFAWSKYESDVWCSVFNLSGTIPECKNEKAEYQEEWPRM
jgi:hypothetical protein